MLRNYILVLLVLAVSYHVGEGFQTFGERMANVLEKKCAQRASKSEYDIIKQELEHVKNDCFKLHIGPGGISDEKLINLCHEQTEKLAQCLITLGKKVESCFDPTEKELKEIILDIYNASTDVFCNHINFLNADQLLTTNTVKCITTFRENPEINPNIVCWENSTIIGDHHSLDIITIDYFCLDVMQANGCYMDLLTEHCPNATEVINIQRGLMKPAIDKCVPLLIPSTSETGEDVTEANK